MINVPNLEYSVITDPENIKNLMGEAGELSLSSVFEFRNLPGAISMTRTSPKIKK
jgi:hypothetical protein